MKKLLNLLLSVVLIALLLVPLSACNAPKIPPVGGWKVEDYFEGEYLSEMQSSAYPTKYQHSCIEAKSSVKVSKITGTAYWFPERWSDYNEYKWAGEYLTTTKYVENVTFRKSEPFSFEFELTVASSKNEQGAGSRLEQVWNEGVDLYIGEVGQMGMTVRNLKIEFEPY